MADKPSTDCKRIIDVKIAVDVPMLPIVPAARHQVELADAEQAQVHQRESRASLDEHEGDDPERSRAHETERRRRRPAEVGRPVDRIGERADRHDDEAESQPVDVPRHALVAALADRRVREQDQSHGHGQVHEQHRAPVEQCRQTAADEGAERLADGGDAEHGADRAFDLGLRERVRHDGEAEREGERGRHTLHQAHQDQEPCRRRQPTGERRQAECGDADHEPPPAAEQVADAAAGDHGGAVGDHVAADDPLEVRDRRVEVAGHVGERGLYGEEVELDREHAQ
jgi:hypothetical protein